MEDKKLYFESLLFKFIIVSILQWLSRFYEAQDIKSENPAASPYPFFIVVVGFTYSRYDYLHYT